MARAAIIRPGPSGSVSPGRVTVSPSCVSGPALLALSVVRPTPAATRLIASGRGRGRFTDGLTFESQGVTSIDRLLGRGGEALPVWGEEGFCQIGRVLGMSVVL